MSGMAVDFKFDLQSKDVKKDQYLAILKQCCRPNNYECDIIEKNNVFHLEFDKNSDFSFSADEN